MADDDFVPPPELAELARELTCLICKQLFDGPVSTDCGHVFCSGCVRESLRYTQSQNQRAVCPGCRDPSIDPTKLRPVMAVRQLVLALPAAAAAVDALRQRAQDAERRAEAAEQEVVALRGQLSRQALYGGAGKGAPAQELARAPESSDMGGLRSGGGGTPRAMGVDGAGSNGVQYGDADDGRGLVAGLGSVGCGSNGWQAGHRSKRVKRETGADNTNGSGMAAPRRQSGGEQLEGNAALGDSDGDGDDEDYASPGTTERSDEDACSDVDDGDYDFSPDSRGASKGRRGRGRGRGRSQVATGKKRSRGRPPKSAAGVSHPGHGGSAELPSEMATTSVVAAGAPPVPPPAGASAAATAGTGDCPLCGSRYALQQLQSHVEMCLVRKGPTGAGSTAVAGGAAAPPVFGARSAPACAASAPRAAAARPGGSAAPHTTAVQLGGRAEAPRAYMDIQVPPTKNWHAMSVREAKKVMTDAGLVDGKKNVKMEKLEMQEMYNRYRSFLLTERDKGTNKTTKQLLDVFLRKEDKMAKAKKLPAEAPISVKASIEQHKARMMAEMAARKQQAASRAAERLEEQGQEPGQPLAVSEQAPQGDCCQPERGPEHGQQQQGEERVDGGSGPGELTPGPGLDLAAGPSAAAAPGAGAGVGSGGGASDALAFGLIATPPVAAPMQHHPAGGGSGSALDPLAAFPARCRTHLTDVITIDDSEEDEQVRRHQLPPRPALRRQQLRPHDTEGVPQPQPQREGAFEESQMRLQEEGQHPGKGRTPGPAVHGTIETPVQPPGHQMAQPHHPDHSTSAWWGGDERRTQAAAVRSRGAAFASPGGEEGTFMGGYGAGDRGAPAAGLRHELLASDSDGSEEDEVAAAVMAHGGGRGGGVPPGLAACLATPQHGLPGPYPGFGARAPSTAPHGAAAAAAATPGATAAPLGSAAASGSAARGPTSPPGNGAWGSASGAASGAWGRDADPVSCRELRRASAAPSAAGEGLMDISNGTGGQWPGTAVSLGAKGPLVPSQSGADGMVVHHQWRHHSLAG